MLDDNILYKAILSLKSEEECKLFFMDLCTPKEVKDMKERMKVAVLLSGGKSYRQIYRETGVSLSTIVRVARFLHQEIYHGYKIVLERLCNK
jgi:TrpR-related protein YerC/YecD